MPANWSNPLITSAYVDVISELKDRDADLATMFQTAGYSNIPTGAISYVDASKKFQRWSGAAWVDIALAVVGGGTGAGTAATARVNLGLTSLDRASPTIAMDPTNVNLRGSLDVKTGGAVTFQTDNNAMIGTNALRPKGAYFRDFVVIPVGTNKYATS